MKQFETGRFTGVFERTDGAIEASTVSPAVTVHDFVYDDPHLSDRLTFEDINSQVEELSSMGYFGDKSINLERKRKGSIDRENPAPKELMRRLPSFSDWLDMVPTAGALDALYHPDQVEFANGRPVDSELAKWLRNISDGRGIRSRGAIVTSLLENEADRYDRPMALLSLASGAAQPVIAASASIRERSLRRMPELTLVDRDQSALSLAQKYAKDANVDNSLETKNINILRPQGIDYSKGRVNGVDVAKNALRRKIGSERLLRESFDVVEAVGIVEYLQAEDWKYTYNGVISTKKPMAGARSFMKNSFDLVKPGGLMIIGNMLDTHPQLGFTLNTIQWPHIQPRSVEQMAKLIAEAGIEGEIDVHIPQDGVYGIYTVRKAEG